MGTLTYENDIVNVEMSSKEGFSYKIQDAELTHFLKSLYDLHGKLPLSTFDLEFDLGEDAYLIDVVCADVVMMYHYTATRI